jgi:DNA-binding MarR family transcriptional regulator
MAPLFASEEVVRLRGALARIARSIDRQVSGGGLTPTQLSVLGTVARMGPISVGELAHAEGLNPTMLSRMVGKLEGSGLLSRVPDPRDGRVVIVRVTEAGAALQERLRAERTRLFVDRLAELPDELAAQLIATLPAIEALADLMRRKSGSVPAVRAEA